MSEPTPSTNRIVAWFRNLVRPIFEKTETAPVLAEYDRQSSQVEQLEKVKGRLFPICLLGQAGVGKSTLVNTLIADTGIVVPSGGGTGPLTANALRVVHGDRPSFRVRYHARQQVNETRFILESQIHRSSKAGAPLTQSEEDGEVPTIDLDADEQKRSRTEEAIGRARLLVSGAQSSDRPLEYLVDGLRWVLGQKAKYQVELLEEDLSRLRRLQEALQFGANGKDRHFDSVGDASFNHQLRDHACGFLAPMILEMTIQWPSPILKDSLELIDLPGIGILSDAYASVTSDYLRNRAKAVMLVADSRGVRREDAELLRNSGFLNRLLHAGNDLTADPVALIVVVVKIDDVAEENWRNDKAINGTAQRTKAQHFSDQVDRCRNDINQRLQTFLMEVWSGEDGDLTEGKRDVIQSILAGLQVFPVSAPQYRLLYQPDPDEARPFLPDVEASNIPALRAAIAAIAQRCLREQTQRAAEAESRFFGQVRARLEVLSAQRNEERQAEAEITEFKRDLAAFLVALQREFDTRRGGFRNFLRKTIPSQIEMRVTKASETARKEINGYLRTHIGEAHWRTLQAAVRREGTFIGSRHINLPHDFALRFEEPVAEVWSRGILTEVRKETREFADFQAAAVNQVLDWARTQGLRISTRLLEALVDAVKQHRQQVNAVGKEAVDDLRNQVRQDLIRQIEGPIRGKCKKFVENNLDSGTGVKNRILSLFEELAGDVVEAASEPAVQLLVGRFREVDKEILTAFGEHSDPLNEAANALIQRQEKRLANAESGAVELSVRIDSAIAAMPPLEATSWLANA